MADQEDQKTLEERTVALNAIAAQVATCKLCPLFEGRTKAVPGSGPFTAEIMFIGEGPGHNEDKQGLPFVGQSGQLLNEFLQLISLSREQVFISNVVKCRPPGNRDPLPTEVDTCTTTYLYKQIELINPKVIVTLGRFSMGLFFPKAKITQIHGQPKKEKGRYYLPLFHPAAILRNMNLKPEAEADFRKIPQLLAEFNAPTTKPPEEPPAKPQKPIQLSLF